MVSLKTSEISGVFIEINKKVKNKKMNYLRKSYSQTQFSSPYTVKKIAERSVNHFNITDIVI